MRILAGVISLGRFIIGTIFIVNPKIMDQAWIGKQARMPGAQVLTRAVGARDLTLGLGGLQAVARNDGSARSWLGAASIADAVDFGATYAAGNRIPRKAASGVLVIAGVFSILSAVAALGNGKPGNPEPLNTAPHDLSENGGVPTEPVGTA